MRPRFGREYVENEFQQIADELTESLTVYLIGGGAMSLRDLKGATKDIDLVVAGGDAYATLWAVVNYPTLLLRRIRASVLEGGALMWTPGNQSPAIGW